jgi:FG-GAP repeat
LIGAPGAPGQAGKATVIFGSKQSGAWGSGSLKLLDIADGQRGFALLGEAGDHSGSSVSGAGDINGDGLDEIMVAAYGASGKTTVVFGSKQNGTWGSGSLNLTALVDGQRGFESIFYHQTAKHPFGSVIIRNTSSGKCR